MTLGAGSRFGAYEVVARLGAGGMGEVWRARDPRLEREVALKVLPASAVSDETARLRLERDPGEQRTLVKDPAYATVLKEHREMLKQYVQETGDPFFKLEARPPGHRHELGYQNHK